MANPIVRVILSAIDNTADGTKKATASIGDWAGKVKSLAVAASAALAGSAVLGFFKSSVDEALAAKRASDLLQLAIQRLGGSYTALKPAITAQVNALQELGFADDEVVATLEQMITVSGDVEGSLANLTIVADLARARNIDLSSAGDLVSKAMAGNTAALTKLYPELKGTTDVVAALGTTLAGTSQRHVESMGIVERVSSGWNEVKEAIGNVILADGQLAQGTSRLVGILGGLASWIEKNEDALSTYVSAVFGLFSAIGSLAGAIWDVLGPPLTWLAKVAFVGVVGAVEVLALGLRRTAGVFQEFAGTALMAIGSLVEKGGKLLKVFGIDVVTEAGTSMKEFGERLVTASQTTLTIATTKFQEGMKRISDLRAGTRQKDETAEVQSVRRVAGEIDKAGQAHLEMEISRHRAAKETNELLAKTAEALRKQNDELRGTDTAWGQQQVTVKNYTTSLKDLLPPVENLKQEIERNSGALEENARKAREVRERFKETVDEAVQLGHGLLDAARAAGVVDRDMASVLGSVLNIADSMASLSVEFSLAGLAGVIGGLANLITSWGNSATEKERKAVMDKLTDAIRANTDALKIGSTGHTLAGTQAAIAAALPFASRGTSRVAFLQELTTRNISEADFLKLAEQFGFGGIFETKDEQAFAAGLWSLQRKLASTPIRAGQSFTDQLQFIQEIGGLTGASDTDMLSDVTQLAASLSPALFEALFGGKAGVGTGGLLTAEGRQGARDQLLDLLKQLAPGGAGVSGAQLGGLTPQELLDAVKTLLPLLASETIDFGAVSNRLAIDPAGNGLVALPGLADVSGGSVGTSSRPSVASITFGDVNVTIPAEALTGDPARDGKVFGEAIKSALAENIDDITTSVLRRANDEYVRQRAAQGLS